MLDQQDEYRVKWKGTTAKVRTPGGFDLYFRFRHRDDKGAVDKAIAWVNTWGDPYVWL